MADEYLLGWHRQGSDFRQVWHLSPYAMYGEQDVEISIEEANDLCGMNGILLEKEPVGVEREDSQFRSLPNNYVLTVKYNQAVATIAGKPEHYSSRLVKQRYEPTQVEDMTACLEPLAKHWPLVGTMALRFGEILVVQLEIDRYLVGNNPNEEHLTYLTVASDLTKNGNYYYRTNTRVVCRNTHNFALAGALEKIHIPHNPDSDIILEYISAVELATIEQQKAHRELLDRMFEVVITDKEFDGLLEKVYGKPKKSSKIRLAELGEELGVETPGAERFMELVEADRANREWHKSRNETLKGTVRVAYADFNVAHPYAANTLYAFYQAVTNVVNHSPLYKGSQQKQEISLLLGAKGKVNDKAFEAAVALLAKKDGEDKS